MSYQATKTNYVKPYAKMSYIRPLFCDNEKKKRQKDSSDNLSMKNPECPAEESGSLNESDSLKSIDDGKDKCIQSVSSAHSKLFAEIDKIHSWAASVEIESKQKDKKVDELNQTIESQRKVLLDFQMQNENLSAKLDTEVQERVSVLEKYCFTKELFVTLRKKMIDLQGQFDACCKMKKTVDICCEDNTKAIEILTKKLNNLSLQYSENILILNNSLKNEKDNILMLKELFEQQNLSIEKEHKSLCKLVENYQEELKNYSKELEIEKSTVQNLQHEKNDLSQRIAELKNSEETNLQKLADINEKLQLTVESKLEIENKYAAETIKVNNLTKTTEELEELIGKQKNEFEETCLALKTTISSLENSLSELKQKLEHAESEQEKLSGVLKERENEKQSLEEKILAMQKENKELVSKLIISAEISDKSINLLTEEKNDLIRSLNLLKEDLQIALSEKENLSIICLENEKKISEMTSQYEAATSKIKELSVIEDKYNDILKKVEEMNAEIQSKTNLLTSKEQEIGELNQFKLKYEELLIKINELEESQHSLSNELKIKEEKIEELNQFKLKYDESLIKISELEECLHSLSKELETKEKSVEELNVIKENYAIAMEKEKEMEETIKHNTECLQEAKTNIMNLNKLLEEKNIRLENLEYDNLQFRDCLEQEKKSLKICLECEQLKDKVKELDQLKVVLLNTEKELSKQKQQTTHVTKMLSETEENFDKMRIKKENEIIKCKDTIETLQHELKILKVEVGELEKLRSENSNLLLSIEEIKLQNAGDMQRLKGELEVLKAKKKPSVSNLPSMMPKKVISETLDAKIEQTPKYQEVMEADSSQDEMAVVKKNNHVSGMPKKNFKQTNKKAVIQQMQQATSSIMEKKKRAWDNESSGSEYLEVVFDNNAARFTGSTPKLNKSPIVPGTPRKLIYSNKYTSSYEKKRDLLQITDMETPKRNITTISILNRSSTPNKKILNNDLVENIDSFSLKNSNKEVKIKKSPWKEDDGEIKKTPTTPTDKKFFKTPLKERETFKKPKLQNLWF